MSKIDAVEEAVRPVRGLPGAKACFVIARDEDNVRADDLSRFLAAAIRELGLALLDATEDRQVERFSEYVVVARRFADVVVCVVGDATMVVNDVQRKLNVTAFRVQNAIANEPAIPVVAELRGAYVAAAGPLSGLVFDREFEELRRKTGARDVESLRTFMETLTSRVTPPGNHKLRARVEALLDVPDVASGSFVAATSSPQHRNSSNPPPRSTPPPARRFDTVPYLGAVQRVTREFVGPLGDFAVQRALELTGAGLTADTGPYQLIDAIAHQLPEPKRASFRAKSKAALDALSARDDSPETTWQRTIR